MSSKSHFGDKYVTTKDSFLVLGGPNHFLLDWFQTTLYCLRVAYSMAWTQIQKEFVERLGLSEEAGNSKHAKELVLSFISKFSAPRSIAGAKLPSPDLNIFGPRLWEAFTELMMRGDLWQILLTYFIRLGGLRTLSRCEHLLQFTGWPLFAHQPTDFDEIFRYLGISTILQPGPKTGEKKIQGVPGDYSASWGKEYSKTIVLLFRRLRNRIGDEQTAGNDNQIIISMNKSGDFLLHTHKLEFERSLLLLCAFVTQYNLALHRLSLPQSLFNSFSLKLIAPNGCVNRINFNNEKNEGCFDRFG